MHSWFLNYLTNRMQYTVIHKISSSLGIFLCGLPQGSVLGPLRFLIYVNDIAVAVPDNKLKLFADDTNLYIFSLALSDLETKCNFILKEMQTWFLANKLSLNIDQTCYTIFSPQSRI